MLLHTRHSEMYGRRLQRMSGVEKIVKGDVRIGLNRQMREMNWTRDYTTMDSNAHCPITLKAETEFLRVDSISNRCPTRTRYRDPEK